MDLTSSRNDLNQLECRRNVLSKQISLVRDVEALGSAMHSHSLNTLTQRYAVFKKKKNDVLLIRNILIEKACEAEKMIEDFSNFSAETNALGNYLMESKENDVVALSEFEMVKDFLENSNQGQLYMQSERLRKELDGLCSQRGKVIETTIENLLQYHHVMSLYPRDHIENHRLTKYSKWCRALAENKSQEYAQQIAMVYRSTFSDVAFPCEQPENLLAFNFQLQNYLAEMNYQLQGNYQRYQQFIDTDESCDAEFHEFIAKNDNNVTLIASEMIKMTKRFLALESSTCSNASNLVDLIINDRWFVDELRIQATFLTNVIERESLMSKCNHQPTFNHSFECLKTIVEELETFEAVKSDFQLNIVPLALGGVISQDKSVLDMIAALSNTTKAPIGDLLNKLEEDFLNCIRNPNQKVLLGSAELSQITAYNNIYAHYQDEDEWSVGKKLFMFFHEAFDKMYEGAKKILSFDKALSAISDEWSSITELQQSRLLFITPMQPNLVTILDQLFTVRRVQAMIEFFSYCLQFAWAFKGSGVAVNFDLEFLTRPLKAFIADLMLKCILGRGTYCLSLLICCLLHNNESVNKCFSLDQLRSTTMSTNSASLLMYCENLFITLEEKFRRRESSEFYQKLIHQQNEIIKNFTFFVSAHHWLYEDYFLATSVIQPIPRANVLLQLQNSIQALSQWNASIQKIDEELKQCTLAIMQRLKWAAGANPLINELMNKFESISQAKTIYCERENRHAGSALKYSLAIINYEMLRFKTQKAIISDEELLNFLQQWESVCIAERQCAHTVSPIEEGLIELLNPDGPIDGAWIESVTSLIDDMINQVHSEIDSSEKIMVAAQDNLHLAAHKLRNLMSNHHRVFADIKNLLKSILKKDEGGGNEMLKEYFAKYKNFIENVTELHGNVLSKDFTDVMMEQIKEQVERALAASNDIYNELLSFEKSLLSSEEERSHSEVGRHSVEHLGTPLKKGECVFNLKCFEGNNFIR
jgi:serine/threonine-protein kinase SMG1